MSEELCDRDRDWPETRGPSAAWAGSPSSWGVCCREQTLAPPAPRKPRYRSDATS